MIFRSVDSTIDEIPDFWDHRLWQTYECERAAPCVNRQSLCAEDRLFAAAKPFYRPHCIVRANVSQDNALSPNAWNYVFVIWHIHPDEAIVSASRSDNQVWTWSVPHPPSQRSGP